MLNRILDTHIFTTGSWTLTIGMLAGLLAVLVFAALAWRVTKAVWRVRFYNKYKVEQPKARRFESFLRQLIIGVGALSVVKVLHLDPAFYESETVTLHFSLFIIAFVVLTIAKVIDWVLSNIIAHSYEIGPGATVPYAGGLSTGKEEAVKTATNTIRYILLVMGVLLLLRNLNLDVSLYTYESSGQTVDFRISKFLVVALILLAARFLSWLISNIALYGVYRRRDIDEGSQFAINQLMKYVIYLVAIFFSLNSLGLNMTLLLGGAAALLVGVGLGLQQTFNDFFSGLVLLFERSVSVGDILSINGVQGTVKKIGLRSSIIETLNNRNIIIPNSQIVNDAVLNWNHFDDIVRFDIDVGVAYGSDTALVKELLLKAVDAQLDILKYPKPFVRFNDFADSSLHFTVYYYSDLLVNTENLQSDVRFAIDALFRDHNISIPFPQRDVWMRREQ